MTSFLPAPNSTLIETLIPTTPHYPFYHPTGAQILPFMTDKVFSLLAPIVAYWVFSLLWHTIDTLQLPYFEQYRIHESAEVLSRNRASVTEVVKAVVIQQVVQTLLGWVWLEGEEEILKREIWVDHTSAMQGLAGTVGKTLHLLLGEKAALEAAKILGGGKITGWVYWWGVPLLQMGLAFFVMDTWQYFLHRLFHSVPFLYRHFHSVHHRLYVPYAFGALYNHPFEGLLLDSLGAVISHSVARMSVRQSILLFAVSTIKTVDDHCGYRIWWDPCQAIFGNNAEYHDLHHQSWGIKKNFSQPFFTKWDDILGTRMSPEVALKQYARRKAAKLEAATVSFVSTLSSTASNLLPGDHSDEDSRSESSTLVDEVDSGIEIDDMMESNMKTHQTRLRSRKG